MVNRVITTGLDGNSLLGVFKKNLLRVKPEVVAIAVAYVSFAGFKILSKVLDEAEVNKVRLVTDTRDRITEPRALGAAKDRGWRVNTVNELAGTFHPKLYIAGSSFLKSGKVANPSWMLIGSSNLSRKAFLHNSECVYSSTSRKSLMSAVDAWLVCWQGSDRMRSSDLDNYSRMFKERAKKRSVDDMGMLDLVDDLDDVSLEEIKTILQTPTISQQLVTSDEATTVWAGLETFTGEFNFQVEFPQQSGLALSSIFSKMAKSDTLRLRCRDGREHQFKFSFLKSMYRLQISNEAPNVAWARKHKKGIVVASFDELAKNLRIEILRPGEALTATVKKSVALASWGRTPQLKRLYGWY